MPCPTRNPPGHESPNRPSESSFSSSTVTSQPDSCSCWATADPTRPLPITIAFTAAERTPLPYVAASSSSITLCGNATISTSQGARRST
jgi:hypothetical protein